MQHAHPTIVVGLDVGDVTTQVFALDGSSGEILIEAGVATTRTAVRKLLADLPRSRVVLEVGTHSRWLSALLQEMGHEVVVANARRLRMIFADTHKSDRIDAVKLARVGRFDPTLLCPSRHRGLQSHHDLSVVRARAHAVGLRTATINLVRGMVKSSGERLPRCTTPYFAKRMRERIPDGLRAALDPMLDLVEKLDAVIASYDVQLSALSKERYPETARLAQVYGVGELTALTYVLTLEDPARFRKSRDVGPALGLVPRRSQSGDVDRQMSITRTGDRYLRSLLVEAAHCMMRTRAPDSDLKRWGQDHASRGGRNARKRVLVAVARRLAVLLHRLWVTGARYEPLWKDAA